MLYPPSSHHLCTSPTLYVYKPIAALFVTASHSTFIIRFNKRFPPKDADVREYAFPSGEGCACAWPCVGIHHRRGTHWGWCKNVAILVFLLQISLRRLCQTTGLCFCAHARLPPVFGNNRRRGMTHVLLKTDRNAKTGSLCCIMAVT